MIKIDDVVTVRNDLIRTSVYYAYPDSLATLELAQRLAVLDKRSVKPTLRECARQLLKRCPPECGNLRAYLTGMSTSLFPETGISQIRSRVERLHNKMDARLRRDGVTGWLQEVKE